MLLMTKNVFFFLLSQCLSMSNMISIFFNDDRRIFYSQVYRLDQACNFIEKETLAQAFFCEFCDISKNTFSYRTPLVAAFDLGTLSVPTC